MPAAFSPRPLRWHQFAICVPVARGGRDAGPVFRSWDGRIARDERSRRTGERRPPASRVPCEGGVPESRGAARAGSSAEGRGDPGAGDPKSGHPGDGDPRCGDPGSGDPKCGDPVRGTPSAGIRRGSGDLPHAAGPLHLAAVCLPGVFPSTCRLMLTRETEKAFLSFLREDREPHWVRLSR